MFKFNIKEQEIITFEDFQNFPELSKTYLENSEYRFDWLFKNGEQAEKYLETVFKVYLQQLSTELPTKFTTLPDFLISDVLLSPPETIYMLSNKFKGQHVFYSLYYNTLKRLSDWLTDTLDTRFTWSKTYTYESNTKKYPEHFFHSKDTGRLVSITVQKSGELVIHTYTDETATVSHLDNTFSTENFKGDVFDNYSPNMRFNSISKSELLTLIAMYEKQMVSGNTTEKEKIITSVILEIEFFNLRNYLKAFKTLRNGVETSRLEFQNRVKNFL